MLRTPFIKDRLKRVTFLPIVLTVFWGLLIQVSCLPDGIYHGSPLLNQTVDSRFEQNYPNIKRLSWLDASENDSSCEILESNFFFYSQKLLKTVFGDCGVFTVRAASTATAGSAFARTHLLQNRIAPFLPKSLYALKSSLLFYD
jgi:hypothetical protein